jgi:hypothetical protein
MIINSKNSEQKMNGMAAEYISAMVAAIAYFGER